MKNWFKTLGIIALIAVIGLAFVGCDNGGGSGSDKFDATVFTVSTDIYQSTFGESHPDDFEILSGERNDLINKVMSALEEGNEIDGGLDVTKTEVESALSSLVDEEYIDNADYKAILDELDKKGYVVAVAPINSSLVGIAAGYKK